MAVRGKTANRMLKDCNPNAVELHFDCMSAAPTIEKS
jgi:hypothetical protein